MDTQPQQAKGYVDSAYLQTTAELECRNIAVAESTRT